MKQEIQLIHPETPGQWLHKTVFYNPDNGRVSLCSTDNYAEFIQEFVPEFLFMEPGEHPIPIGHPWLAKGSIQGPWGYPKDDEFGFQVSYLAAMWGVLRLKLLLIRLEEQGNHQGLAQEQMAALQVCINDYEERFKRSPLNHFFRLIRQACPLEGEELLIYVMKRHISYERKSFRKETALWEQEELVLLMRLALSRLGIIQTEIAVCHGYEVLSEKIRPERYSRPHQLHQWPVKVKQEKSQVFMREIRDPRFRRFRK